MASIDDAIFADIFSLAGSSELDWEVATRCSCYSTDSHQPAWGCPHCGGFGVTFADAQRIRGLFRSQSRWTSPRSMGQFDHGEAQLTLPAEHKPTYEDNRVRDRFTVVQELDDVDAGRVFYPAAPASPFLFANQVRGWRVQLQSAEQRDRVVPQP